jgi:hypothetical protein
MTRPFVFSSFIYIPSPAPGPVSHLHKLPKQIPMKHFFAASFLIAVSLCLPGKALAQQDKVYFDMIDIKSGLPESSVRDMKEDALGYIWMATQNGLVRYDGYNYKVYNLGSEKLNERSYTNITSLYLDKRGTLWVGTITNGIFRYDRPTDTFIQYVFPIKSMALLLVVSTEDRAGNIWGLAALGVDNVIAWKLDPQGHFELFGRGGKRPQPHRCSRDISSHYRFRRDMDRYKERDIPLRPQRHSAKGLYGNGRCREAPLGRPDL